MGFRQDRRKSVKRKKKSSPKKTTQEKFNEMDMYWNVPSTSQANQVATSKSTKLKLKLEEIKENMTATNDELEYRKSKLIENDVVERSLNFFRCTTCHKSYKETINDGKPVKVHPFLGVLMCENCCDYYGDGNFSMGSDGEDKYCRWCGEGGTILTCSRCIYGFCVMCIKKHFGLEYLKKVKNDDDWLCLFCNPRPLWELRFVSSLAEQVTEAHESDVLSLVSKDKEDDGQNSNMLEEANENVNEVPLEYAFNNSIKKNSDSYIFSTQQEETTPNNIQSPKETLFENSQGTSTKSSTLQSRKRIEKWRSMMYVSSSDETEEDQRETPKKRMKVSSKSPSDSSFLTKKVQVIEKLKKILKLTEYQCSFGSKWGKKTEEKLADVNRLNNPDELLQECQKIKWGLSMLSSQLIEFCNSIDSIEKFLSSETKTPVENGAQQQCFEESPYSSVLLFLNFVTNQVKTFMDKKIPFQDVLDAEVYNDSNVIGIKKKGRSNKSNRTSTNSKNVKSKERKKGGKANESPSSGSETEVVGSEKALTTPEQVKEFLRHSATKDEYSEILAILENA